MEGGEAQSQATKSEIIELLVLLFSRSELRDIVGTDALRSVLAIRYQDMRRGTRLDLEPLWDLLCDQPGFDVDAATPPLCKLERLQKQIGLEVQLPAVIAALEPGAREARASSLAVPRAELEAALPAPASDPPRGKSKERRPRRTSKHEARWEKATGRRIQRSGRGRASEAPPAERSKRPTSGPASATIEAALEAASGDERRRRRGSLAQKLAGWQLPLALVAVAGLSFGGYTFYRYAWAGPRFQSSSADFGPIPVERVERLGTQVGAVLSDPSWLDRPREEREDALGAVLGGLDGVEVVYLMSSDRTIYATAKMTRSGSLRFEFPNR